MTFNQFLIDIFQPYIITISYFMIILIGNMLTGVFVNIGDGWGKIRGSSSFQPKSKLMIVFVIEAIIIALILDQAAPKFQSEIEKLVIYFPTIVAQFGIIFYLWFNRNFKFKNNWLRFGIAEFIVVIFGYVAIAQI